MAIGLFDFERGGNEAMGVQAVIPFNTASEGMQHLAAVSTLADDAFLVRQAKAGRESAFGELYERHHVKIYRTAFRVLRNQQDAEDAAQRAFQRAYVNLSRFRGDSAFATWLTRIVINEALMLLRQRRGSSPVSESHDVVTRKAPVSDPADEGPTPEQILSGNERSAAVFDAISRLRESLRIVVLLREIHGYTNAETARRLGLTVSAVKARTFHAKRYLRRHLESIYGARRKNSLPLRTVKGRSNPAGICI
jgi:RNA polymerase sigma-70 factor, ECF subfamily